MNLVKDKIIINDSKIINSTEINTLKIIKDQTNSSKNKIIRIDMKIINFLEIINSTNILVKMILERQTNLGICKNNITIEHLMK